MASSLHYNLKNIACSGATLAAGIIGTQNVNDLLVKPQIDQLLNDTKPDIITLTIGANDVDWTTILAKCYTSECGTADDTASVNEKLAMVKNSLQTVYNQIRQKYGVSPPHLIVTGYHQVFPDGPVDGCTDVSGIDASELLWGRQLQTSINQTLQQSVVGYSFVSYVPIDFTGHELCTPDPWVQGIADKQPYHPTADGQAAFAKQIAIAIKALH